LENLKGRDHLKDLGVNGEKNIKIDIREIGWEGMDWIHMVQDRDHRLALVNTLIKLWTP
jgi:hypothetical protein